MDEGSMGMVILGAIILVCSIVAHALQRRFWIAVTIASVASALMFQVAAYIHAGYLDPFFIIAIVTTLAISALSAILVGLIFQASRKL